MRMKLMIALPLMMLGLQAYAQTGGTTTPPPGGQDQCQLHPEACGAVSQDLQDRCKNNPTACEQFKQKMQADCNADPTKCSAVKSRLQANQAAVQNYNSSNPNAAQQESNAGSRMANREGRRTERRQKWKENHGGQSGGSSTPQQ